MEARSTHHATMQGLTPIPTGKQGFLFWGLALGVLLLAYGPVLTAEYGIIDDYEFLLAAKRGMFAPLTLDLASGGRPLVGPILDFLCRLCGTIHGLWWMRAITLAGLAFLSTAVFAVVRAGGWGVGVAAGCALGTVLGPGCAVYAAWATCVAMAYGAALALVGGHWIWKGTAQRHWRAGMGWQAAGIVAIVVAYSLYQPAAAFGVFAVLVLSWKELVESNRWLPFARAVAMTLVATAIYFVLFKLSIGALDLGSIAGAQAGRSHLVTDWAGKGMFLLQRVFASGFSMWGPLYGKWAGWGTMALLLLLSLGACLRTVHGKTRLSGAALAAMAVALPLSVLPIAVVVENHTGFRVQAVLHAMVVFWGMAGIDRWTRGLGDPLGRWTRGGCVAGICLCLIVVAHRETLRGLVAPHAREVELLHRAVNERFTDFPEQFVYETPTLATRGGPSRAEFSSRGSSHLRCAAPPLLNLLLRERFPDETRVATVLAGQPPGGNLVVIDGFLLLHEDSGREEPDPFWGRRIHYSNGWSKVDWFGRFDDRAFPWIRHSELGWLNCATNVKDGLSFHQEKLGWLWTSPQCYPDVKREDGSWIHYSRQLGGSLAFYDYSAQQWFSVVP